MKLERFVDFGSPVYTFYSFSGEPPKKLSDETQSCSESFVFRNEEFHILINSSNWAFEERRIKSNPKKLC